MKRESIEWALGKLLPEGWRFEQWLDERDGLIAVVRHARDRSVEVVIPKVAVVSWTAIEVIEHVLDAIERALGVGRYATTPVIKPEPPWSPYP